MKMTVQGILLMIAATLALPGSGWCFHLHILEPEYQIDSPLKKKIVIEENKIFFSNEHALQYRNAKDRIVYGEEPNIYTSFFDVPKYLPGEKGLALFHIRMFYEPPHEIGVTFYSPDGKAIGQYKDLKGASPEFSPNGEYFVTDSSDPYSELIDGAIRLCKIDGKVILTLHSFKPFFKKYFPAKHADYGLLQHQTGSEYHNFIYSDDSKYFGFAVVGLKQGLCFDSSAAYIFILATTGKVIKHYKLSNQNPEDAPECYEQENPSPIEVAVSIRGNFPKPDGSLLKRKVH